MQCLGKGGIVTFIIANIKSGNLRLEYRFICSRQRQKGLTWVSAAIGGWRLIE
ncbi:hypothetical protein D9M68_1004310 [compost metagenome]